MRIIINNFLVQMGYRYVAQVDLEVLGSNGPSASASSVTGTITMCHHTQGCRKSCYIKQCVMKISLYLGNRKCKQKRVAQHKTYSRHSFTSDMTYFHPLQKKKKKKKRVSFYSFIYFLSFFFEMGWSAITANCTFEVLS